MNIKPRGLYARPVTYSKQEERNLVSREAKYISDEEKKRSISKIRRMRFLLLSAQLKIQVNLPSPSHSTSCMSLMLLF